MTKRQSITTLSSVYIGTVIGAGFASGQEILQFFGKHGRLGMLGVVISTVLFCCLGSNLLQMIYERRITGFNSFLRIYFSKRNSLWINYAMTFFLLIGYIVMLAGGGAILEELFSVNVVYGVLIMSVICFTTFIFGVDGIARINNIIVPLLLVIILFLSIMVFYRNVFLFEPFLQDPLACMKSLQVEFMESLEGGNLLSGLYPIWGWLWSAILYVSFNSIVTVVVLTTLLPFIKDKRSATWGGLMGGIGLGFMAILILMNLLIYYTSVHRLEVPMIAVANNLGIAPRNLYSLLLWFAMFTTAIANGYGSIKNTTEIIKVSEGWSRIIICAVSIPLAMLGFRRLITFFYPLLGYMGIIFLFLILFCRRK